MRIIIEVKNLIGSQDRLITAEEKKNVLIVNKAEK
jgi:hypothetical protein